MSVVRRSGKLAAVAAGTALVVSGLTAIGATSATAGADDAVSVKFAGTLSDTTAYTTVGDEQMHGMVRRMAGAGSRCRVAALCSLAATKGLSSKPVGSRSLRRSNAVKRGAGHAA